ncbi:MAG: response regulator [Balneolaceae bacterium]
MTKEPLKILLVEDDESQKLFLERIISRLGHTVMGTVSSGHAAIRSVEKLSGIDLILMDVRLDDDMDGIAAMAEIRKTSDIKVIYISGFGDDEMKRRAVQTHYHYFLTKPVTIDKLKFAIDDAFSV